jgi:hypothetical protein
MDLNIKKHPMNIYDKEARLSGVGANGVSGLFTFLGGCNIANYFLINNFVANI